MHRRFPIISLVALVATVAACGGSSASSGALQSGDVAVVETIHITHTQLDRQIAIVVKGMSLQKQTVPTAGSTAYKTQVIQPALHRLVQNADVQLIAQQLKVSATPAEVTTALNAAIKQYYGGDQAKYQADLKKYGLSTADVHQQFQTQALEQKITTKLQNEVKVTPQQVQDYYNQNKAQYTTTADTRTVHYLLLPSKAAAQAALASLKAGTAEADVFTAQHAIDGDAKPGQAATPLTFTANGGFEANFVAAGVKQPTGVWGSLVPVSKSYMKSRLTGQCKPQCYFLINPVSALVKKGTKQSFDAVKTQIETQLKSTQQQAHVSQRVQALFKAIEKKTKYATGFAPPSSLTSPTTTSSTSTATS